MRTLQIEEAKVWEVLDALTLINQADDDRDFLSGAECYAVDKAITVLREALEAQPAQRKPEFKEFIKWAGAQGYDCGQTCNSDTGEWIALNPMTADLWKAWQAAHGIKGDA